MELSGHAASQRKRVIRHAVRHGVDPVVAARRVADDGRRDELTTYAWDCWESWFTSQVERARRRAHSEPDVEALPARNRLPDMTGRGPVRFSRVMIPPDVVARFRRPPARS